MKPIAFAAVIAASLTIIAISCNWFDSVKKEKAFDVRGTWVVDSMENHGNDTSFRHNIGLLVLALNDSIPLEIEFSDNGRFQLLNTTDSLRGGYDFVADSSLLIVRPEESNDEVRYKLSHTSDTAFTALAPDSLVYFLRRK